MSEATSLSPAQVELRERKSHLRGEMRARRLALDARQRASASAGICDRLVGLWRRRGVAHAGQVSGVYLAKPDEANIDAFIAHQLRLGTPLAVPRSGARPTPPFALLGNLDAGVEPGSYGVRVPVEIPSFADLDVRLLNPILVPGLAFDALGGRLGYGIGWYDRALPPEALIVGVCFECQIVERVPCDAHDRLVSAIVTQSRVIDVDGRLRTSLRH